MGLMTACGGGGGGGSDAPSLLGPSNATLSGTWTGSLSRPSGLAPITVRWIATHSGGTLSGPITLTNGAGSITYPVTANISGGPQGGQGYSINLNMAVSGGASNLPACGINGGPQFSGLTAPVTSMTSNVFNIEYNDCRGFVDPPPPRTGLTEATQMNLTKQ